VKRYAVIIVALLAACGGGSTTPSAPAVSTASASPSPAASSSPTTSPTQAAAPVSSPSSLAFTSGSAQNLTVTESGYTGSFTESDTCNPTSGEIASVVAGAKSAGSATYAVTPIAAGTCTVTVLDTAGHATAVDVTVSTAAITVQ
jgi:hypothetical protein